MILAKLTEADRYAVLHPLFARTLEFLRSTDLSALEPGMHTIQGEQLFAIVEDCAGRTRAEAKLECHRRYIDIQLVQEGVDEMGWKDALKIGLFQAAAGGTPAMKDAITRSFSSRSIFSKNSRLLSENDMGNGNCAGRARCMSTARRYPPRATRARARCSAGSAGSAYSQRSNLSCSSSASPRPAAQPFERAASQIYSQSNPSALPAVS